MKVYLSRWTCLDVESNLARLREEADEAAEGGSGWVVFPESFLNGYTRKVEPERCAGPSEKISAAHPATAFFFGSFTEDRRNRMTVWQGGREVARYDKVHLFGPNDEPALWDPGDRYAAVDLGRCEGGAPQLQRPALPRTGQGPEARGRRGRVRGRGVVALAAHPRLGDPAAGPGPSRTGPGSSHAA